MLNPTWGVGLLGAEGGYLAFPPPSFWEWPVSILQPAWLHGECPSIPCFTSQNLSLEAYLTVATLATGSLLFWGVSAHLLIILLPCTFSHSEAHEVLLSGANWQLQAGGPSLFPAPLSSWAQSLSAFVYLEDGGNFHPDNELKVKELKCVFMLPPRVSWDIPGPWCRILSLIFEYDLRQQNLFPQNSLGLVQCPLPPAELLVQL